MHGLRVNFHFIIIIVQNHEYSRRRYANMVPEKGTGALSYHIGSSWDKAHLIGVETTLKWVQIEGYKCCLRGYPRVLRSSFSMSI